MKTKGFTLPEFLVGLVFVGVVLGPFLLFAVRVQALNATLGQQARREAWRSLNDRAVALGIDPALARVFSSTVNPAVPAVSRIQTAAAPGEASAGLPRLVALKVVADAATAEPRLGGAGYQLGAGEPLEPRGDPAPPLEPIIMPTPAVTPADGAIVPVSSLKAAAAGAPYVLNIEASSNPGTVVNLSLNQPHGVVRGPGSARQDVTAVDMLASVSGMAWTEYPGSADNGDSPVTLADGRTRWLVRTQEGRLQIYEPSGNTRFAYRIGLGTPVLVRGAVEYGTGAVLGFDYVAYAAVRSGGVPVTLAFPASVRAAFGNAWPAASIGFQWTFGATAGPFSGDLRPFFNEDVMALWTDVVTVTAIPVAPEGAVAEPGTWTLGRLKVPLGPPVLSSVADDAGFFTPGQLEFSAPAGSDGTRVGRLSFQNGTTLSTGPTLSFSVTP